MTDFLNLIEWIENNVDVESETVDSLLENVRNYDKMSASKQKTLRDVFKKAFKKGFTYVKQRISRKDRKKFKSAYMTKKGYWYATRRKRIK